MINESRIRERAHQLWEAAGQPHGLHEDHWDQACREIEEEDKAASIEAPPTGIGTPASAADPAAPMNSIRSDLA